MQIRRTARYRPLIIARHELLPQSPSNPKPKPRTNEMNSFPSISHRLFVAAAGHENRPQSRAGGGPSDSKEASRRGTARERSAKRVVQTDTPRQPELLAGVAGAG